MGHWHLLSLQDTGISWVRRVPRQEWGRFSFSLHAMNLAMAVPIWTTLPLWDCLLSLFTACSVSILDFIFAWQLYLLRQADMPAWFTPRARILATSSDSTYFGEREQCRPYGSPNCFLKSNQKAQRVTFSSLLVGLTTLDLGCHQSINLADRMQPTETDSDSLDSSHWSWPMEDQVIAFSQCAQPIYNDQRPHSMGVQTLIESTMTSKEALFASGCITPVFTSLQQGVFHNDSDTSLCDRLLSSGGSAISCLCHFWYHRAGCLRPAGWDCWDLWEAWPLAPRRCKFVCVSLSV